MPNPIVHFEISSKDGKRAQDFYSRLFDWKIQIEPKMNYGMVNTGAKQHGGVDGGIYQAPEGVTPCVTVYVQVDDLQKYLDKAVAMGAKVTLPPTQVSPEIGWCAMFTDPDGNAIGLFK